MEDGYRKWILEQINANELQMRILSGAYRVKKVIAGKDWKTDDALQVIESDMVKSRLAIDELKIMLVEHDSEQQKELADESANGKYTGC